MAKIRNEHLDDLYNQIVMLNVKLNDKENIEYTIDLDQSVIVFLIHKHLKITVVFENQYKEAVIYFDGRFFQYIHWHLDNNEALDFVNDLIDEKIFFVESRLLRKIGSQFTYKILKFEKYELLKNHYLGKRRKNIFTISTIIQGDLKQQFS